MSDSFEYDVFISYSSEDKSAVLSLAERLKADGLRVWLDDWIILPGDSIPLAIERGLESSRTQILVMSERAHKSDWVKLERNTTLYRDPTNAERRFVPLRLDDTPVKDTLRQFSYVDWRDRSQQEYDRLLLACKRHQVVHKPELATETRIDHSAVAEGSAYGLESLGVTPDGAMAVTGGADSSIRVWELNGRECILALNQRLESGSRPGVAIIPDGRSMLHGAEDDQLILFDLSLRQPVHSFRGHRGGVLAVAVAREKRHALSASEDSTLRLWDLEERRQIRVFEGHTEPVCAVAITPSGRFGASGSEDSTVRIWDLESGTCNAVLRGHKGAVKAVAISEDGSVVASGSHDMTVRVWDVPQTRCLQELEGHTGFVEGLAMSSDGQLILSASRDGTLRAWIAHSGICSRVFTGHATAVWGVAMAREEQVAVSCSHDGTVRVWDLPPDLLRECPEATGHRRYTNAKVLLIGDTGAGKTGLANRLTREIFETTSSTDGHWATQMRLPHSTSTPDFDREIWLWDFAGQADYRLVHQLFMDETSVAVLIFNPQNENPFKSLERWDRDLARAARRRYCKLLVAARIDRGRPMVGHSRIQQFADEHRYARYLETSAKTGEGCAELRSAIANNIDWESIPWTTSPRVFKLLKDEIIGLRDEGVVLLRLSELKQRLEMRQLEEPFSVEVLLAVVSLLAGPGIVWRLDFGDFVLLQPERVNAYASAVIRRLRQHTEEYGVISEEEVLAGDLDYHDMPQLPRNEEDIVLRAMHQVFVARGLCLRESTEMGTQLVFPAYFRRELSEERESPPVLYSFDFSGAESEIYATLIVRLCHTTEFTVKELFRYAAEFEREDKGRVGLIMKQSEDRKAGISVYLDPPISSVPAANAKDTPEERERLRCVEHAVTLVKYVHEHLLEKADHVERIRRYSCTACGSQVSDQTAVLRRMKDGKEDIACSYCEERVSFQDEYESHLASEKIAERVQRLRRIAKAGIDAHSTQLVAISHAYSVAEETGQTFRQLKSTEKGFDGEIEFVDGKGDPSGRRLYLQLTLNDWYLHERKGDAKDVFKLKDTTHARLWKKSRYPVMLVNRCSDGVFRWCDVGEYLWRSKKNRRAGEEEQGDTACEVVFQGQPFTARSLQSMRDKLLEGLAMRQHSTSVAMEAGHVYRPTDTDDSAIDAEIEFKTPEGDCSGRRICLLFGDRFYRTRQENGTDIFEVKDPADVPRWKRSECPVMLVNECSDGTFRWLDLGKYLSRKPDHESTATTQTEWTQVVFDGDRFDSASLQVVGDAVLAALPLWNHTKAIADAAGHAFQGTRSDENGIDGGIEFRNNMGAPTGLRVDLQFGDSFFCERRSDGTDVFRPKYHGYAALWEMSDFPVMLISRCSDGAFRWMDVREFARKRSKKKRTESAEGRSVDSIQDIVFDGEPFDQEHLQKLRDDILLLHHATSVAGKAKHFFQESRSDESGVDAEIRFRNPREGGSGQRVYLQLALARWYEHERQANGTDIFMLKDPAHADTWQCSRHPVMLVNCCSDDVVRWMDVGEYFWRRTLEIDAAPSQNIEQNAYIAFDGLPLTAESLQGIGSQLLEVTTLWEHTKAVVKETGGIFRRVEHGHEDFHKGVDAKVEFDSQQGSDGKKAICIQFCDALRWKSQDDGSLLCWPKRRQHPELWANSGSPVMLVNRCPDGVIQWMDLREYFKHSETDTEVVRGRVPFVFDGESFTAENLARKRESLAHKHDNPT